MAKQPTPTIEQLETLIDEEGDGITILPDGQVVVSETRKKAPLVLTQRRDLGSNY